MYLISQNCYTAPPPLIPSPHLLIPFPPQLPCHPPQLHSCPYYHFYHCYHLRHSYHLCRHHYTAAFTAVLATVTYSATATISATITTQPPLLPSPWQLLPLQLLHSHLAKYCLGQGHTFQEFQYTKLTCAKLASCRGRRGRARLPAKEGGTRTKKKKEKRKKTKAKRKKKKEIRKKFDCAYKPLILFPKIISGEFFCFLTEQTESVFPPHAVSDISCLLVQRDFSDTDGRDRKKAFPYTPSVTSIPLYGA